MSIRMTCPHASDPAACLSEYRRRTASLLHSWETIPCTSCPYLRINGERVPRPVDESLPFAGKGPPRVCSECGGAIGNTNKSGMCQECIHRIYGDSKGRTPRQTCVHGHNDWGIRKDKRGKDYRYCKACERNRQRERRRKAA